MGSTTMSKVDLETNKAELIAARDRVLHDKEGQKYAVFGYKDSGDSNVLTVETEEENVEGGLNGMLEEFSSGRIQYGLAVVKLERGNKSVLVMWQGEGTPIIKKSMCAHHQPDIAKFMKPTSTFIARSDEELDVDSIMKLFT